jgi:hypothetical protein
MNTITIWNKGRRPWNLKNAEGATVTLESQESVQVEEVYGLRMVAAYPKDLTTTGVAAPSLDDIKRREQSLRDREANLDAREKALGEREKALEGKEDPYSEDKKIPQENVDIAGQEIAPAKRAGRPPKADKAE